MSRAVGRVWRREATAAYPRTHTRLVTTERPTGDQAAPCRSTYQQRWMAKPKRVERHSFVDLFAAGDGQGRGWTRSWGSLSVSRLRHCPTKGDPSIETACNLIEKDEAIHECIGLLACWRAPWAERSRDVGLQPLWPATRPSAAAKALAGECCIINKLITRYCA